MQAAQDVQIDSRISRTQYQYTLQDADPVELTQWAPRLLAELRRAPNCATWRRSAKPRAAGGLAPQSRRRVRAWASRSERVRRPIDLDDRRK